MELHTHKKKFFFFFFGHPGACHDVELFVTLAFKYLREGVFAMILSIPEPTNVRNLIS